MDACSGCESDAKISVSAQSIPSTEPFCHLEAHDLGLEVGAETALGKSTTESADEVDEAL